MPGGLKGFKQERPRRGCSSRGSSGAEAQRQKGVGTFLTEWLEGIVGREQEVKMQKEIRPFRKPKNTD